MTMPEQVLVARDVDVEPLLRAARAEIAQLSLQIRSANREADEIEAALAEHESSARDLLRTSLDELIESKRQELESELEHELVRAAAVVSAAQEEVARSSLGPSGRMEDPMGPARATPPEQLPSRRLQVVADDETDGDDEAGGSEDLGPDAIAPAVQVGISIDAPLAGSRPLSDVQDVDDQVPPLTPEAQPVGDIPSDPALLRELVSAAVTAAVAQAVSALQTGIRPVSAAPMASAPETTGVHTAIPVHPPQRPRPSLWRRLLHVDVLLPLVLVVIVFVVLLAWVG